MNRSVNKKNLILSIVLSAIVFVGTLFSLFSPALTQVKADISDSNLETTYISEDLSDIDITLYPKNENGRYKIIRFQEYCYSEKAFYSQYYGLYFYLYNPTEKEISVSSSTINMAVSYNSKGEPSSYEKLPLKLCDKTANNRFYKFKILNSMNNTTLLATAQDYASKNNGTRRYDILSVEVYHVDGSSNVNAVDGKFAQTYYYSGYAASCGDSNSSTLSAVVEPMATLELKPHATTYRPEGHNETSEYTQDSLHSVWFSVPNMFIEQYGTLTAVKATWLNAVLNPCLVTGNEEAYNAILPYLGQLLSTTIIDNTDPEDSGIGGGGGGIRSVSTDTASTASTSITYPHNSNLGYCYLGVGDWEQAGDTITGAYKYGYAFNRNPPEAFELNHEKHYYGKDANPLYLMFASDFETKDSVDSVVISSEEILQKVIEISNTLGGEKIIGANGNYSKEIFESIDEKYTTLEIATDTNFPLESIVVGPSWWDRLWGKEETTTFNGIKGLETVTAEHMALSDSDLSSTLYLSSSDISDLRADYEAKSADETIYLLRYMVSDYTAQEARLLKKGSTLGIDGWSSVDTNARFFQETVNLNFDIIQVTCSKEEVETIIPVVSNPIDIFPESTPALDTTTDREDEDWWQKLVALICVVLLVVLYGTFLAPIVNPIISGIFKLIWKGIKLIIKGVFSILTLPLRLIFRWR